MGSELIILPIQSCFLGGYSAWMGWAWGRGWGLREQVERWGEEGVGRREGGGSRRRSNSSRNGKQTQRRRKATEARCCCSKPRPQGFHWPIVIPPNDVASSRPMIIAARLLRLPRRRSRLPFHQRIPEQPKDH